MSDPNSAPNLLLSGLNSRGVKIHTEQTLAEITEYGAAVETPQGEKIILETDSVVPATGAVRVKEIADRLRDGVPEVYLMKIRLIIR